MVQTFQIVLTSILIIFSSGIILINLLKVKSNKLLREKGSKFLKWYNIYFCLAILWLLGELLLSIFQIKIELHDSKFTSIALFPLYKYAAIFLITPLFGLYILSYMSDTLGMSKKLRHLFAALMFFVFIPAAIKFIINPEHKVISYTDGGIQPGSFLTIMLLLLYTFLLFIIVLIALFMLKKFRCFKKQVFLIVLALAVSYVMTCINFQIGLKEELLRLDIAPAFFIPPVLLINFYALRYTLLCITPVAFPRMTDDLREAILIIDAQGTIAYYNRSLENMFSKCHGLKLDSNIKYFADYLRGCTEQDNSGIINSIESCEQKTVMGEIRRNDLNRTYSVNIKPLMEKNIFNGQVVTFFEITEYKKLLNEVNQSNDILREVNEQLKDYTIKAGELAAAKERNKLASEVHDSIGHTMTVLISLIGVCSILCDKDIAEVKQKLDEMLEIAMKGHDELRNSVLRNNPRREEEQGLMEKMEVLVKEFEKAGVKVDFYIDGLESTGTVRYANLIHRICQEALTNSLKHGKATQVSIILRLSIEKIILFIFDNGIGCKKINKNLGLRGMEERVKEVNGEISYGSDGETGFNINVEIPVT